MCIPKLPELPASLRAPAAASLAPSDAASSVATNSVAARKKGPGLSQRLLQRATMGWTMGLQDEIDTYGYDAWLESQLDFESFDDTPLEESLHEALPTLSMTPQELIANFEEEPDIPAFELLLATLFRSAYSPRQLYERMVVFWTDHFNITLFSDAAPFLKPIDDRDVIRRHAMGSFPELLHASAHSPAMLVYLTNDTNEKGHPNENYARELMELHTLGADRGYDQDDVREVSRAFTGWTMLGPEAGERFGQFGFNAFAHDNGKKTVLGRTIPAGGGEKDGGRVLEILAGHRLTAEFLSTKLLRHFWGYDPPQRFVNKVTDTYLATGGDVREMLRVVLRKAWMKTATPKLKRPYHHMVSAVRALGASIEDPFVLLDAMFAAGHLPFLWELPNGYPDSAEHWSSFVLPRLNLPAFLLDGALAVDIPALDPDRNPSLNRAGVRGRLNRQLTGSTMSGRTKTALRDFLAARPLDHGAVRDAVHLAIASPEFQTY